MDLGEELSHLVDVLAREKIDYALCGGLALAVHGHPRFTKGIDLLVRPEDVDRIAGRPQDLADIERLEGP